MIRWIFKHYSMIGALIVSLILGGVTNRVLEPYIHSWAILVDLALGAGIGMMVNQSTSND